MPFSYHPPTGRPCEVCDLLHAHDRVDPIIDTHNGKASSANNFPFHNWYNFVLGYSPEFPEYMLQREKITRSDLVLDPFMGSGTTLVVCKMSGIPSQGIDANNFMVDTARTKLLWNVDLKQLKFYQDRILHDVDEMFRYYCLDQTEGGQLSLFMRGDGKESYKVLLPRRPEMLPARYISDKPLAKALIIQDILSTRLADNPLRPIFELALTSIIVPISNVRYGPGFGVQKPREDVDVLGIYSTKLNRMIADLERVNDEQRFTPTEVKLGDARTLSHYFAPDSVALMVTSPPYPGDHEYTKHTRLELIFRGYARNNDEFRIIKKRMLRASTTNIYHADRDREPILDMVSIQEITDLIQNRLDHDGATSGFEKLYTKLIWEYFGGMYKALDECFKVLQPGGKIALLVSDSHAFKMVHVQTAKLLQEIGERIGFIKPEIILWQLKSSTSHKYSLRENILVLTKPR